jgi:hypothetical protein
MVDIPYNWEFVCTYQMIDDDPEMANFLYQIQVTTAFCMKQNLIDMMSDTNPETNVFESKRVQELFDYLVDVMHLHKNTKFVDILRKHPMTLLITPPITPPNAQNPEQPHQQSTDTVTATGTDTDASTKQFVRNSLLWLISFHSFHVFHKCIIDIATYNDIHCITDENLKLLEQSFKDES